MCLPSMADIPDIPCGPVFKDLPANHIERLEGCFAQSIRDVFFFYKMVVKVLFPDSGGRAGGGETAIHDSAHTKHNRNEHAKN